MADPIQTTATPAVPNSTRSLPFWHYPAALALGVAHTFAFAPTPHGGWIQLPVLALLFAQLLRTRGWLSAALTGGAFGFGNFVTGVWWLYVSMHDYGGMAPALAGAALALFSLYLALYPAIAGALWSICSGHARSAADAAAPRMLPNWRAALIFAAAWALGEWLRGTVLTGFPWLGSGYAQIEGPLAGYAPLVGVYGVSFVLALVAALIVQAFARPRDKMRLLALPAAAALISIGLALANVKWTHPFGQPISVRLLQGNIPQSMKFNPDAVPDILDLDQKLLTGMPADLVITSETAVPIPLSQLPESFGQAVRDFADRTGSTILLGAIGTHVGADGQEQYANSLFQITPNSRELHEYDKHHLVPFGEFIPWGFHWFIDLMKMPLGDLARGAPVQPPFEVKGLSVLPGICYEDLFGEEVARAMRDSAVTPNLLVNATNLGWFGNTIALDQHLEIARMRALETGRPVLRATNTGMTAAIGPDGHLITALQPFSVSSLWIRVQGMQGLTPYVRVGNSVVILLALALLGFGFVRWRKPA